MTAPTVTVLPKPETVLDVDLSAEVPCFFAEHGAATWSGTFSVCRHVVTCCEKCHTHCEDVLARPPFKAIHRACKTPDNVIEWRRL